MNRLAVLEVLCKNQAQTINILQAENSRLQSSLTASTSMPEVLPVQIENCRCKSGFGQAFCGPAPGHIACCPFHCESVMLISQGTGQEQDLGGEAIQPSSFVPFKGSSHTLDEISASRSSTATYIPARHQPRSFQPAPVYSAVHSLSDPASPLRPLQREEFLAKLPRVCKSGSVCKYTKCLTK